MKNNIKKIISVILILATILSFSSCSSIFEADRTEVFSRKCSQGSITVYETTSDLAGIYFYKLEFEITPNQGETKVLETADLIRLFSEPTFEYACQKEGFLDLYYYIRFIEENDEITSSQVTADQNIKDFLDLAWEGLVTSQTDVIWGNIIKGVTSVLSDVADSIFSALDFLDQLLSAQDPAKFIGEKFIEIIVKLDKNRQDALKTLPNYEGDNAGDQYADSLYTRIEQIIKDKENNAFIPYFGQAEATAE